MGRGAGRRMRGGWVGAACEHDGPEHRRTPHARTCPASTTCSRSAATSEHRPHTAARGARKGGDSANSPPPAGPSFASTRCAAARLDAARPRRQAASALVTRWSRKVGRQRSRMNSRTSRSHCASAASGLKGVSTAPCRLRVVADIRQSTPPAPTRRAMTNIWPHHDPPHSLVNSALVPFTKRVSPRTLSV